MIGNKLTFCQEVSLWMRDHTLVGEGNESFLIRMWKPLSSGRIGWEIRLGDL